MCPIVTVLVHHSRRLLKVLSEAGQPHIIVPSSVAWKSKASKDPSSSRTPIEFSPDQLRLLQFLILLEFPSRFIIGLM